MANLCSSYVTVTGDKGAVTALVKQIERQGKLPQYKDRYSPKP